MKLIKISFGITVCLFMLTLLHAQQPKQKPKPEKAKSEKIDTVNPPPEQMVLVDTDPLIDFDTTAVPDDELTRSIKKLLDLTGYLKSSAEIIKTIYETEDMKALLPEDFRNKFIAAYEENGFAYKYLALITIKNYRKYFTLEDIKQLTNFYETPAGKKMTAVYPELMRDNSLEGAKLGKWVASKIM
jgi:hypothetical protein